MIRIDVQGAYAFCIEPQLLTVGMVGAEVEFSFDEPWETLTKCAVFTDGMETRDAVVKENRCTIPYEVLTLGGRVLCVGVYGTNETGDVVIPTVYADVGMIRPGADPSGDESYSPTPDVTTQILNRLERLESGMGGSGNGSGTAAGVSVTHQWNGTVLSVTSASGTSSADLKGEKGDKGDPGEKGDRGEKGDKGDKGDPGDGAAITFFDLAAMGLPAVTPDGTEVALAADTSEMQTALASGSVKFGFQFSYGGMTIAAELTGAPMYMAATDTYQVSKAGTMAGAPMFISIMVGAEEISAVANVLQAALPNAEGASF